MLTCAVGDYSLFHKSWQQPSGGIHGYLNRFLASGDPTFQHIAIWTLLQLLESKDDQLTRQIESAEDMMRMVREVSEKTVASDDETGDESEDGEGEVVALATRCLQIVNNEVPEGDSQPSSFKN